MRKIPQLTEFGFQDKTVLVRGDFDVPLRKIKAEKEEEWEVEDETRIRACLPTIEYLLKEGARVILLGHLGRPEGKELKKFSLKPVADRLEEILKAEGRVRIQGCKIHLKVEGFPVYILNENLWFLENLRFFPGEEGNEKEFAKKISCLGNFYVNEAFAASHREQSSIVGIPKFLPHCAGFNFVKEVENLSKVLEKPKRPLVFIIGGAKPETKLPLVTEFAKKADCVLVGGRLPLIKNAKVKNVIWGSLTKDGLDISKETINKFAIIIKKAGTIVWNGPMGKYEMPERARGTKEIAEAMAESGAFKVAGGGDTIAALNKFKLLSKMDFVSLGGGAMLEFLAKGSLPGIEALVGTYD